MSDAISAAVISASVAAIVAIVVLLIGRIFEWRDAKRRKKSEAVLRMLGVVEAFIMQRSRPVLVGLWRDGPNSLVLAQFRFLADLSNKDEAVAVWVWGRIQRVVFSPKPDKQVVLASEISGALVAWLRGTKSISWFKNELRLNPVDIQANPPAGWQRKLNTKNGAQIGLATLIVIWFGWLLSGRKNPLFD